MKRSNVDVTVLPPIAYKRPWLKKVFLFLLSNTLARLLMVLLAAAALVLLWSWFNYRHVEENLTRLHAGLSQQEKIIKQGYTDLLERLGRHMFLPADETPVVATITDIKSLSQGRPFYQNAQNGDKVIIYTGSKMAIIYNPTADKIVNIGPVINEANQNNFLTEENNNVLVVEIRNGSSQNGIASKLADELESDSSFSIFDFKTRATRRYAKTVLVDLGEGKSELVKKLESRLGVVAVNKLPAGEKKTKAEVLIILGNK